MPHANPRENLQQLYRLRCSAVQLFQRPPAAAMPMPKLLICGMDGTLRRCRQPGQAYPLRHADWELMPNVAEVLGCYPLRVLQQGDMTLGVVANQDAVVHGELSPDGAEQLLWEVIYLALALRPSELFARLTQDAVHAGPPLTLLSCPSGQGGHLMRLPNPGMLGVVLERHGVWPREALMVGSTPDEATAASLAGVPFLGAWDFFGWPDPPRPLLHAHRCDGCQRYLTLTCHCLDAGRYVLCETCEREG